MSGADLFFFLQWYLALFLTGTIFLPLTVKMFPQFFDKGYIFSKIISLAVTSYLVFLLGTLRLLPFSIFSIILSLVTLPCLYLWYEKKINSKSFKIFKKNSLNLMRAKGRLFLLEEIIFLTALFTWSYVRSFSPDIHGLEKYMDFGFINSILRTRYFPPQDIWFTPLTINYYYFGHLATAVLTKLSNVPSFISFNLMIATIFALSFTASFSIGCNLYYLIQSKSESSSVKIFFSGLLTSFLVTFSGNLHTLYSLFKPYDTNRPVPFWHLSFSPATFPNNYWYPNATRFIYNTIHEFPIYSWVVSDLHGHVLDIPFVLLGIALLLSIITSETHLLERMRLLFNSSSNFLLKTVQGLSQIIFLSLIISIMYMTNAWDGAIYLGLAGVILIYTSMRHIIKLDKPVTNRLSIIIADKTIIKSLIVSLFTLVIGFIVFSLPFSLSFKPFTSGIGILSAPAFLTDLGRIGPFLFEKGHTQHSPWWQLLILYGSFLYFIFYFIVFLFKKRSRTNTDSFVIFLISLSLLLIAIPEVAYVKDIYPEHYRANTMFKLSFQAFIMLSLSSSYIFTRLISLKRVNRKYFLFLASFIFGSFFLLATVFSYPYFAISSYYGALQKQSGLNGIQYLKTLYPSDFAGIEWLNKNISGQPVILEAQGDSYTDYARVSSNTGLPTVLGWTVHEWLWRGTYDIPAPRITDIKSMYESSDLTETKKLLKKYNVKYVYIGELERQKYSALNIMKFNQLGKIIYSNQTTKIYQLNLK